MYRSPRNHRHVASSRTVHVACSDDSYHSATRNADTVDERAFTIGRP